MSKIYASASVIVDIPFHDVDMMGIVWHGRYAKYLEIAREVMLGTIDYTVMQMKASGYAWPVIEMNIRYAQPLRFEQKVRVQADLIEVENRLKIDPLLSIAFTLFILVNVIRNVISAIALLMQATPDKALHQRVVAEFLAVDNVREAHHVHVWSLDGEHHVLTAHLGVEGQLGPAQQLAIKEEIRRRLDAYDFLHTTIEFEFPDEACRDGLPDAQ